eukprot:scaffold63499_cov63-Phaeocystis_antarctica.AAC.5
MPTSCASRPSSSMRRPQCETPTPSTRKTLVLVKVVNAWFACLQPHVLHQPHVAGSHEHVSRAGFWRLTEQETNTGSADLQIGVGPKFEWRSLATDVDGARVVPPEACRMRGVAIEGEERATRRCDIALRAVRHHRPRQLGQREACPSTRGGVADDAVIRVGNVEPGGRHVRGQ